MNTVTGRTGTFYLNNTGHRWVNLTNGVKDTITLKTESGQSVTRTVIYYRSFGQHGLATISYKGKKISVFPDSILSDTLPDTMLNFYINDTFILVPAGKYKELKDLQGSERSNYIESIRAGVTSDTDFYNKMRQFDRDFMNAHLVGYTIVTD